MRAARPVLIALLVLATSTITNAQGDTNVNIGDHLYTFAKIRTVRVTTGDVSLDNDGQVDRDLLLVPVMSQKDSRNAEHLDASPTRRFLILNWKYCIGVNGMALTNAAAHLGMAAVYGIGFWCQI